MAAAERLRQVNSLLSVSSTPHNMSVQNPTQLPWNPDSTRFPSRKELPRLPNAPEGAAWVWGEDDEIGRLNLLTPTRVKAAVGEIKTGEIIRLDLPLDVPKTPAFGREVFQHNVKEIVPGVVYDDTYALNTQSGTQWDGFRHFGHIGSKTFYNSAKPSDIYGVNANPSRCSIHHWSTHGIAGRAILLDYRHYADANNITYSSYTPHAIPLSELHACARSQGLDPRPESQGGDIKPGDILMVRSGFINTYLGASPEQRSTGAHRNEFAGVAQDEDVLDWLHDCYFAALVGDSPTFEAWPPRRENGYIHQQILALWGMPLGEMWDLERLSERCRALGKWAFFVTSAPANVAGGVGSHANATAIL